MTLEILLGERRREHREIRAKRVKPMRSRASLWGVTPVSSERLDPFHVRSGVGGKRPSVGPTRGDDRRRCRRAASSQPALHAMGNERPSPAGLPAALKATSRGRAGAHEVYPPTRRQRRTVERQLSGLVIREVAPRHDVQLCVLDERCARIRVAPPPSWRRPDKG